jgi:hypothetical protein
MVLVVDIRHWLLPNGDAHPSLRTRVLRIARLIEYGGPLPPRHARETLVECSRRPRRKQCPGLLWVAKLDNGALEAHCELCNDETIHISGWDETIWAEGPMPPVPLTNTH